MPTVSVIIPAYNAERFLAATVASVLAQTFDDFELIIVNDGSSDGTGALADALAAAHPEKIRCLHQENRGVGVARNVGAQAASGMFLGFLDADDLWLPDKLAVQTAYLRDHAECGLVFADVLTLDETGRAGTNLMRHKNPRSGDIFPYLLQENFVSIPSTLLRRECFQSAGGFLEDRDFMAVEDYHFWLKVTRHHRGAFLNLPLARYRIHATSLSSSKVAMWEKTLRMLDLLAAEDPGILSEHRSAFRKGKANNWYEMGFHFYREGDIAQAGRAYLRGLELDKSQTRIWKGLLICALVPDAWLQSRNNAIPKDEIGIFPTRQN